MKIIYELPKLYIISNNKKRFWHIWIEDDITINREYGIIGGKIIIPYKKKIESFKKAITEVNTLWRKKKESGFNESLNIIQLRTNKIKPMGAHKLNDHSDKIKYPALVQRKLDGFRCLANISKNNVTLNSKNMKPFVFLHHIKKEILTLKSLLKTNIYLDGELYEYGLHLHEISSLVMKKYASKNDEESMKKISYYVFDMFDLNNLEETFLERYAKLSIIFNKYKFKYLNLVTCEVVNSYFEIKKLDEQYLYEGYEGIIVRNIDGLYKLNSKSYNVLRTKEFKKKEFKIIGAKKGTGTQDGAIIWKLECLIDKNSSFWAIPVGTIEERIKIYNEYLETPNTFLNKKVFVKFLDIDKNGCVIRNPIVIKS